MHGADSSVESSKLAESVDKAPPTATPPWIRELGVAAWMTDANRRICYANSRATQLLEMTTTQRCAQPCYEIVRSALPSGAPFCGGGNLALMPVVSANSPGAGHGGTNALRSFSGMVQILDQNTLILAGATSPCGTWGTNLLSSCMGILNQGLVYPPDLDIFDDSGLCSPPAPDPLFTSHQDFGVIWL